jgi:hypothetical protein
MKSIFHINKNYKLAFSYVCEIMETRRVKHILESGRET